MEIWKKLKQDNMSLVSFWILFLIALAAVYAPLIANNKPFVIYTQNRLLYIDFLDNAQGNAELIVSRLEKGETVPKETVELTEKSLKNIAAFLTDETMNQKLGSYPFSEWVENKKLDQLNALRLFLSSLRESPIRKRFFFPLFQILQANDIFFMLLLPLIFFLKLMQKKIKFLKSKSFWDLIFFSLILSLAFTFLFTALKKEKFDPYAYKKMAFSFEKGEWALFPIIPFGENENILTESSQTPAFFLEKERENQQFHVFGTDTNGRDVLARMVYGARISMSVGFVSVGIYVLLGIFIGALAGYFGGAVDTLISRLIEIMICFPVFFLILTVMAFLRPSIFNIMVIIGLTGWPGIARLMRGEFLRLKNQEFVLAEKALGASDFRIMFRHILPNGIQPIIISATFGIAGAILTESALSFLGFGVPQPTASWGDILNNGRNNIYKSWWLTVFPGFFIFLTVTAFNLIGEKLRDILDPKSSRGR